MKKIVFTLVLIVFAACSKNNDLSLNKVPVIANFTANIEPFIGDGTKASITSTTFRWSANDSIGIWPLTVTPPQTPQQHKFSTVESGTATAVFSGSGWGLLTDGESKYAAYFPYRDNSTLSSIPLEYDSRCYQTANLNYNHIGKHLFMYAPAIAPTDPEEASFSFKQIGCLLTITCYVPSVVTRGLGLELAFLEPLFVNKGTFRFEDDEIIITPVEKVTRNVIHIPTLTPSGDHRLVFNTVVSPAEVKDKEMTLTLYHKNGRYRTTVTCNKNWISGRHYTYTVRADGWEVVDAPAPVREGIDLGTGVLWATTNVGAESVCDPGIPYQWGAKTAYSSGTTPTCYKDGSETQLLAEDDIASLMWNDETNKGWRMPTRQELNNLLNNCRIENSQIDGVHGIKVYNKSDDTKNIFIPYGEGRGGSWGRINLWSSTAKSTSRAYYLLYDETPGSRLVTDHLFSNTFFVRPVKDLAIDTNSSAVVSNVTETEHLW